MSECPECQAFEETCRERAENQIADAFAAGREAERRAIVEWLRERGAAERDAGSHEYGMALLGAAGSVRDGAHLKGAINE